VEGLGGITFSVSSRQSGIVDENIAHIFQGWEPYKEIRKTTEKPEPPFFDITSIPDNEFLYKSAISDILGLPLSPIFQRPYKITEAASNFIISEKRSKALEESLDRISSRISEFMKKQDIRTEIIIDLEVDTEYEDWIEPRIRILVESSKLEKSYSLFGNLLKYSLMGTRKREMKRIRITLDKSW